MNIGKTGAAGEACAAQYLQRCGFGILRQNYQTRFGEVDIIAAAGSFLVFAEVKTRRTNAAVSGAESVTAAKQRRILAAAQQYLLENESGLQPRFDVIEVVHENGVFSVRQHIEDAFGT